MSFTEITLLATICLLGMLSPGPDFILVTRNAIMQKRGPALATAFGIIAGCLVHASYCLLGLAFIITQSILLYNTVKYLGAAYLIYIGIKGLLSKKENPDLANIPYTVPLSLRAAFMQGFLCNVLNPKLAVFLLSLFTQFIKPDAALAQKAIVISIFLIEAIMYWPILVLAFQLPMIRNHLRAAQHYIDKICGAILLGLGAKVALSRS